MELAVLVERVGTNGYTARDPFGRSASGPTADAAVANLRATLTTAGGQVVTLQIPQHPAAGWIGIFKDNPLFDEWTAAIEENRRKQDAEDAARLAAESAPERG